MSTVLLRFNKNGSPSFWSDQITHMHIAYMHLASSPIESDSLTRASDIVENVQWTHNGDYLYLWKRFLYLLIICDHNYPSPRVIKYNINLSDQW